MSVTCKACEGTGWVYSSTLERDEIQRCDVCEKYQGDIPAWVAVTAAFKQAMRDALQSNKPELWIHLNGVYQLIKKAEPLRSQLEHKKKAKKKAK